MTNTADEARDVGDRLMAASTAIKTLLDDHGDELELTDRVSLRERQRELLLVAAQVTNETVDAALTEMQTDAAGLKAVIDEATAVLTEFNEIRKAIRMAAAVVSLATAIATQDGGGVVSAANDIRELTEGDGGATA
jgi:hypothetical protein